MKKYLLFLLVSCTISAFAQETKEDADAFFIKSIYNTALGEGQSYAWLEHLTTKIGGRLSGSKNADQAIAYTRFVLDTMGMDSTWLLPCQVPLWIRGEQEQARITNGNAPKTTLNCTALGNSVGTGPNGITGEVIELQSLDELESLGKEKITGKIVFFNRPMDPTQIRTFNAYGGAVDQRVYGPAKAAAFGATAVIVRSMTTRLDDVPHTGVTVYDDEVEKIPAFAISTNDAEMLSELLTQQKIEIFLQSNCKKMPDVTSYSVVGEIKGSEFPDEIILVGGHLDSWDIGQGAHDDGAGCVHAMEVPRILKKLNYKPKRTLRVVLFMNEENGLGGGRSYAEASNAKNEFHMAALESDSGGFTPRGFSCIAHEAVFKSKFRQLSKWAPLLEPYGLSLTTGGSGADINPLKSQKGLLIGFRPDSQRYFDYHHTGIDTFDAVNQRELELGAAAITSLIFLLDKYGLQN